MHVSCEKAGNRQCPQADGAADATPAGATGTGPVRGVGGAVAATGAGCGSWALNSGTVLIGWRSRNKARSRSAKKTVSGSNFIVQSKSL
mmetsp:Transcript_111162/g.227545  ORF Transcript_111162/g.227545 Transcript_111162/m.227545 type:complete len:89 (-) Transcript_111162:1405-1671(-)